MEREKVEEIDIGRKKCLPYDEWTKKQGIGVQQNPDGFDYTQRYAIDGKEQYNKNGWDDVADALVYNEKSKLQNLLHEHPNAPNYRILKSDYNTRGVCIKNISLKGAFSLYEDIREALLAKEEVDETTWVAVQWRVMTHHLVRWHWNGGFEERQGEQVWVPGNLGRNLYPSTQLEVSNEPYIP